MKEIEKRLGLNHTKSVLLKKELNEKFKFKEIVNRTVLVKVEGENFIPDIHTLVDMKIKLIGEKNIWSTKYGSWHKDASRAEYNIHFERNDLTNVIATLNVLSYNKFILLSTLRTIWENNNLQYTLDEYKNINHSLFEVEALEGATEANIDHAFLELKIEPMNSEAIIAFISKINSYQQIQINLTQISIESLASRMLKEHLYDR